MEKFSRFTEDKSGVNPFTFQPYRPGPLSVVGGFLFLVVKLPLALVAGLLLLICAALTAVIPLSIVTRILRLTLERIASRLLLACLGYIEHWNIDETRLSKAQVRLRCVDPTFEKLLAACACTCRGFAGLRNPMLLPKYAPCFTMTSQAGGLRELSLFAALKHSVGVAPADFGAEVDHAALTARTLQGALQAYKGPVIIFPEGANTNNRAVLTFTPVISQISDAVVEIAKGKGAAVKLRVPIVHVIGLKHSGDFTPTYTAGNAVAHVIFLAMQFSNALHVYRLPEGAEPQPADFAADALNRDEKASDNETWGDVERDALVQLLRGARAVSFGIKEYNEFLSLYYSNASKKRQ